MRQATRVPATASVRAAAQDVEKRTFSVRPKRKRLRKTVDAAKLAAVRIHTTTEAAGCAPRRTRLYGALAVIMLLAGLATLWYEAPRPAEPENVFLFEELPPEAAPQARPDPSPPPPTPPEPTPLETPPPQFGLQQEQLSEAGELAVATGNTLMTEADSVIREPVAALPARPEIMDQAPRILKGRAPEYPYRALQRGLEATVVALITIDTLGRVSDVVIEQSGGREFDPEVIRAVKRLVFQPPVLGGRAQAARFRQPYEFRIQ